MNHDTSLHCADPSLFSVSLNCFDQNFDGGKMKSYPQKSCILGVLSIIFGEMPYITEFD